MWETGIQFSLIWFREIKTHTSEQIIRYGSTSFSLFVYVIGWWSLITVKIHVGDYKKFFSSFQFNAGLFDAISKCKIYFFSQIDSLMQNAFGCKFIEERKWELNRKEHTMWILYDGSAMQKWTKWNINSEQLRIDCKQMSEGSVRIACVACVWVRLWQCVCDYFNLSYRVVWAGSESSLFDDIFCLFALLYIYTHDEKPLDWYSFCLFEFGAENVPETAATCVDMNKWAA